MRPLLPPQVHRQMADGLASAPAPPLPAVQFGPDRDGRGARARDVPRQRGATPPPHRHHPRAPPIRAYHLSLPTGAQTVLRFVTGGGVHLRGVHAQITCPPGVRAGDQIRVHHNGDFDVTVPFGVSPGQTFHTNLPAPQAPASSPALGPSPPGGEAGGSPAAGCTSAAGSSAGGGPSSAAAAAPSAVTVVAIVDSSPDGTDTGGAAATERAAAGATTGRAGGGGVPPSLPASPPGSSSRTRGQGDRARAAASSASAPAAAAALPGSETTQMLRRFGRWLDS